MGTQYVAQTRVGVDVAKGESVSTYWFEHGEVLNVPVPEVEMQQLLANGAIIPQRTADPVQTPEDDQKSEGA